MKIKKYLDSYKVIFQNTFYLSIIEAIRLIMPFIALPYIITTIGATNYGVIIFSQTIVSYFSIVINWGLDVTSVREVSLSRGSLKKMSLIVSTVFTIKFILFGLCFSIFMICLYFIPFFQQYRIIYIYSFLSCFSEVIIPVWFFQGIEKMKYLTYIRTTSIVLYTILVFTFIKKEMDFTFLALLQSLANITAGVFSLVLLLIFCRVKFVLPTFRVMKETFCNSTPFFVSRVSFLLNTNIAKTMSGLFLNMHTVAAFDLSQKILSFVSVPIQMLNQAIYPHVAKNPIKSFSVKMLYVIAALSLILSVLLFFLAPYIILYFSEQLYAEALIFIRILCLYVFCFGINTYLGTPLLVAYGFYKPFNFSVIYSTLFVCSLYGILYVFNLLNGECFALAMFLTELFILIYRFYYCLKFKLI